MRKLSLLCFSFFIINLIYSQAPQGINYQAVARNAQGLIIPAQNISVRFSVLEGSVSGATIYQETHNATTNNYGLFTLVIGKGTPASGTFPAVNWASGTDKFLKVEISFQGGTTYELQGTTQLLSVPYALYSEKKPILLQGMRSILPMVILSRQIIRQVQVSTSQGRLSHMHYRPAQASILQGQLFPGHIPVEMRSA